MLQLLNASIAVVSAVGGLIVLFAVFNWLSERLPNRWETRVKPLLFAAPALALVALVLVYPVLRTFVISFADSSSSEFVGLENYRYLATSSDIRNALWNNVQWLVVVPVVTIAIGLVIAVLADRLSHRWETVTKTFVFLPMVISFVGASTIWGFLYEWQPAGTEQTGLLNAIWAGLGQEPVAWLSQKTLNNFMLMAIMIWLQAGFAMVLLSAAIKNVPAETVEAARVDGAGEASIFFRIVMPQIKSTIAVVGSTLVIFVLKVFDIVYVMTNGNFGTDVVAVRFIKEIFDFRQYGHAAAIVVALLLVTTPVMVYNVRRFRQEEALR